MKSFWNLDWMKTTGLSTWGKFD